MAQRRRRCLIIAMDSMTFNDKPNVSLREIAHTTKRVSAPPATRLIDAPAARRTADRTTGGPRYPL